MKMPTSPSIHLVRGSVAHLALEHMYEVLPEVIEVITEAMVSYGNPSSSHHIGRTAKSMVERARKKIANQFNASIFKICGNYKRNLLKCFI